MRLSKYHQRLILILLGLLVFLAAYFGVARRIDAWRDGLDAELAVLSEELTTLRGYEAARTQYTREIEESDARIKAGLAAFPGDIRSEDLILYVTELEEQIGIDVMRLEVIPPELLLNTALPEVRNGAYQSLPVSAIRTGVSVGCTLSYQQMKRVIDYIYKLDNAGVSSIAVSYNPGTGGLLGTLVLEKVFVVGPEYTYVPTEIPGIKRGTENPFGTLEPPDTASTEAGDSGDTGEIVEIED